MPLPDNRSIQRKKQASMPVGHAPVQRTVIHYGSSPVPGTEAENSNEFKLGFVFDTVSKTPEGKLVYTENLINKFKSLHSPSGWDTEMIGWLLQLKIGYEDMLKQQENLQITTMRDIFKQARQKTGIQEKAIWEMVVDLDLAADYRRAELNTDVREYKKRIVPSLQKGWVDWTSCFDTSKRLYELLSGVSVTTGVAGANDAPGLQTCMYNLVGQMRRIEGEKSAAVFRVNLGDADHSFTIVVQGRHAEILQSFAGESGESLAFNLANSNGMSTGSLCVHLLNVCKPREARKASSEALFNGEVMLSKQQQDLWPTLGISWSMSSLKTLELILQLVMEKAQQNLSTLKKLGLLK